MPRNYQAAADSTTSQRARESCYKFKTSESLQQRSIPLAKYDGARLSLRHFKSEKILEEEANEFQSRTLS